MKLKRVLTGIIGLPIVALILIFSNKYIIDVIFTLIAILCMSEYLKAFRTKAKPVKLLAYLSCFIIAFIHVIPEEWLGKTFAIAVTSIVAILFIKVIVSNMKTNINDIMITFFGMIYIVLFLLFITLLYGFENGKYLIWYIFISAWGSDTFAYFVGSKFGKHKLSKISPKKSIEGCIGGIIGAILISLIYTFCINRFAMLDISYIWISLITVLLSILSQIGDLSASTIKRTVEIKDFGNLIPGHGGLLDRIDSVLFIAPFAYFLLTIL